MVVTLNRIFIYPCILISVLSFSVQSQLLLETSNVQEIQKSHIDANVPTAEKHERYIEAEIRRYFKLPQAEKFEIHSELLRNWPTQSGMSYPKFYRWVRITKNKQPLISGAIRYAVMEKKEAEILDFVDAHTILNDPSKSLKVFPAEVYKEALTKTK